MNPFRKKITLIFLVIRGFLTAFETLYVESEIASYHGKEIFLKGNAVVEHPLGRISAQRMDLLHDQKLYKLNLDEQVKLILKGGVELECGNAEILCNQMKGTFKSTQKQPQVIYTEATTPDTCLIVKSGEMAAELTREGKDWAFKKIQAQEKVSIHYNNIFTAFGEFLTYDQPGLSKSKKNQGNLTLQGLTNEQECYLLTGEGDFIRAQRMTLDMQKRCSFFTQPHGELKAIARGGVVFSADSLQWNDPQHLLILEGNVNILQPGIGEMTTDHQVILYRAYFDGKWQIRTIRVPGKCTLNHHNPKKNALTHTLICYGSLEVDRLILKAFLKSPLDSKGNVLREQQIHYIDPLGEIYADTITISYAQKQAIAVPSLLVFEGNVYISNQFEEGKGTNILKEYVLADKVEYHPQTKEMYLSALHGKRVLFYDKIDNLQVSAPSLKIKRDRHKKKDSIQGYGDVRFSFMEHEFDKLKSRFLLDKK
ncbi:hypothetical protein [Parachlamydia sp. AcF125]|uniref:hypothetical protein n=1 Tax=Parachlamydia sp. AcF125 TaxID=2795736 RepID=UPI001BCA3F36|nr:hypothetical protein [Parachlamydia sp. AcF125]MBS4169252.1 hypothetical protein [Parachlamydia sp. AcF125]